MHSQLERSRYVTRYLGIAALVVVLDQLSKWFVQARFEYGQRLDVLPFLDFTLVYNTGAAFSFLADQAGWQRWILSAIAVLASLFILWLLFKNKDQKRFCYALALILGGAIGNLIDRLDTGRVVDFILLHWQGWHYPAFNIADMAITFGAALIILDELLRWKRQKHVSPEKRSK